MKTTVFLFIFLGGMFGLSTVYAQLSPGKLTNAHAELEGITNCTQCHTLGEKISDAKCLACHKEIKTRIEGQIGYHASSAVKKQECSTCHSEHHGRGFDMVRFDQENFDHKLTGYALTGAHQRIDCRQCHIPDFVEEPSLKDREKTFLGLSQQCKACHEDVHQNTLSTDCASCHITESFAPAKNFDHSKTDFALLGKHAPLECIDCHQKEERNGQTFQVFAGVDFKNCNSCHDDVHDNQLGTNCKQCHDESSFASTSRMRRFDHRQTNFPLNGAHKKVDCAACHQTGVGPLLVFQDRLGISTQNCVACHEDVHEDKFGQNCAECHQENSFQEVRMDQFNHGMTDFDLKGKHVEVDCRDCHTASYTEPLAHQTCADCHTDYHEGAFVRNFISPDCAECHTEEGFDVTLYSIEQHQVSTFPLEGAHVATPCFACHLQDEKWRFREIGERCVDCHQDVHQGYISEQYYPEQDCEQCHTVSSWMENVFDHNLTAFALEGKHREQDCMACHGSDEEKEQNRYAGFSEITSVCATCHEDVHQEQFAEKGITDCARCHGFNNWSLDDFDHNKTAFKLEGKHAEIACEACHQPEKINDQLVVQYKFESFACVACHQ